jgi:hypothetical protein
MWKCPDETCAPTVADPVRMTKAGDVVDTLRCDSCHRVYAEYRFRWVDDPATVVATH